MIFQSLIHFLKLIRWQNLVIIIITQYLIRFCIIEPMIYSLGQSAGMIFLLQMSSFNFFLLVLSTVLIGAAGNVINDYFDLKIDRINKPEKIIVGRFIKRRVAMGMHIVLNSLGLLIGAYVSIKIGIWKLMLIQVFAIMSLWYYSTHFKHVVLTGNFIIALLASIIPLIVGLFEIPLINYRYGNILNEFNANFNFISYWIIAFSVFAFIFTLAREITKDIADIKGDEYCGSYTIPIAYGINTARIISMVLYFIAFILILFSWFRFLKDFLSLFFIIILILVPLSITIFKTYKAQNRNQFLSSGNWNKIASVGGILFTLVARYIILH